LIEPESTSRGRSAAPARPPAQPEGTDRDVILDTSESFDKMGERRRSRHVRLTIEPTEAPREDMAKRTRGSHRPGQRHADRHRSARFQTRAATRPASVLSKAEEARAAELESEILAQERADETSRGRARERDRDRATQITRPGRAGNQGLLAARAAEEYAYVVRDVRRILVVGGAIVVALAAVYVLVNVAHVITIG
jgi:hypothetical protein